MSKKGQVQAPSPMKASTLTEQSKADLFRGLYHYLGLSRSDIGRILKISPGLVDHYLKKYNIPLRDRLEAVRLACQQGKCRLPEYLRGEKHPNWRGGRTIGSEGYIYIKCREHPRANTQGYVREHIVVWEQTHNRSLPDGWSVHHLNGIKTDNRPDNLIALPSRKHKYVLKAKANRIKELEDRLSKAELTIKAMLSGQLAFGL